MQASDWINLAIAIFTAIAAVAALVSARASRQAVDQANQSAEDSRKIAEEQTKALMTAAKANALASRIEFYNKQILEANEALNKFRRAADIDKESKAKQHKEELELQQDHLTRWLDQQTNALGVGLGFKISDSKYNERIKD
jgi:hypothetical protein